MVLMRLKPFLSLLLLEARKASRTVTPFFLPMVFYLLALVLIHFFIPFSKEKYLLLRVLLWLLLSLSLKISFGAFFQADSEKGALRLALFQKSAIETLVFSKVLVYTTVYTLLCLIIFLPGLSIDLTTLRDLTVLPVFLMSLISLQSLVELLTLHMRSASYLCYLLLLPLELPILILAINNGFFPPLHFFQAVFGIVFLSVGALFWAIRFILRPDPSIRHFANTAPEY